MTELVIVGAGGHGREIAHTLQRGVTDSSLRLQGFLDDGTVQAPLVKAIGIPHLGPTGWLEDNQTDYVLGIGDLNVRGMLDTKFQRWGRRAHTVIAADAHVGRDVVLSDGVYVAHQSVLTTNITIGRHSHVNVGCVISHDSSIGEFSTLSPRVTINGDCSIGSRVFFGTGAIITRGVHIGDDAVIGAGAVVLSDVPDGARIFGIPGRQS